MPISSFFFCKHVCYFRLWPFTQQRVKNLIRQVNSCEKVKVHRVEIYFFRFEVNAHVMKIRSKSLINPNDYRMINRDQLLILEEFEMRFFCNKLRCLIFFNTLCKYIHWDQ